MDAINLKIKQKSKFINSEQYKRGLKMEKIKVSKVGARHEKQKEKEKQQSQNEQKNNDTEKKKIDNGKEEI